MNGRWNRRSVLKSLAAAGVGASLSSTFEGIAAARIWPSDTSPYGSLSPRNPSNGSVPLLALPPDFSYRILSFETKVMSDGNSSPPAADGMAAFSVGGAIRLLRNHEIKPPFPAMGDSLHAYDSLGGGGVTTLVVDPVSRRVIRDFLSLSGTVANCSGGATPWGSWISCEETLAGRSSGYEQSHGYCFEVPAAADSQVPARPLKAMGRFNHEAVVFDPDTGAAYLTEDEGSAGFYRFVPNVPGVLSFGGRLQALGIEGSPRFDTRRNQVVGRSLPVRWIDIAEPDPAEGTATVFEQGRSAGAAVFRRLEGAIWGSGSVYFSASTGGDASLGQIWRFTPARDAAPQRDRRRGISRRSEGQLTLLFESRDSASLKAPDNVCLGPNGSLLICEDSTAGPQYVRCLTPSGDLFDLVRNSHPTLSNTELAGVTFSPDGATLFLNIYALGTTVAIWGPWSRGPV